MSSSIYTTLAICSQNEQIKSKSARPTKAFQHMELLAFASRQFAPEIVDLSVRFIRILYSSLAVRERSERRKPSAERSPCILVRYDGFYLQRVNAECVLAKTGSSSTHSVRAKRHFLPIHSNMNATGCRSTHTQEDSYERTSTWYRYVRTMCSCSHTRQSVVPRCRRSRISNVESHLHVACAKHSRAVGCRHGIRCRCNMEGRRVVGHPHQSEKHQHGRMHAACVSLLRNPQQTCVIREFHEKCPELLKGKRGYEWL